ncbi:MAG: prephenate dehydratase [bacterium]
MSKTRPVPRAAKDAPDRLRRSKQAAGHDRELSDLRQQIDRIDRRMLDLLNRRAKVAIEIGKAKAARNLEFHSPSREREIYERLCAENRGPFPNEALRAVFREVFSASLSLEKPLTVSFLGPCGTFTHLACMEHFGRSGRFLPERNLREVFDALDRGRVHYGVIPIENSAEGLIAHTLDLFMDFDVKICAEIFLEVTLDLLSRSAAVENVRRVYSHPHAVAQCRSWLDAHLPQVEITDVESTVRAAEMASMEPHSAAVATGFAGKLFDLNVLEPGIQDGPFNYTRFLVVGRKDAEKTGRDKTSLMFYTRDRIGALYEALKPFAQNRVSVTRIESRPHRTRAWESVFFLDIQGHRSDARIRKALEEFGKVIREVKLLGSYPQGEPRHYGACG